jgi:hypothetical protein
MKARSRNHPVRRARRAAVRLSGASVSLKAPFTLQPDFVIVGAQRCGTTSMFKTIIQHPNVARPFLRKGVHYFDKHFDQSPAWYRGHFPIRATSTMRRLGRGPVLTGESSPYYMFHPWAAERIAASLPEVKVIALLRDPVERAYSAYTHEKAKGFETLSFPEAIEAESERIAGERDAMLADPSYDSFHLQHHAYVTRGEYLPQVESLVKVFGPERVLVVDAGDFFERPAETFAPVLPFLGLATYDGFSYEQHNARGRSPLEEDLRQRLDEHYRPHDEALAAWWGRTPSWRR